MEGLERLPLWLDLVLRDFAEPNMLACVSEFDLKDGNLEHDNSIFYTLEGSFFHHIFKGSKINIRVNLLLNKLELFAQVSEGGERSIKRDLASLSFSDFKLVACRLLLILHSFDQKMGYKPRTLGRLFILQRSNKFSNHIRFCPAAL